MYKLMCVTRQSFLPMRRPQLRSILSFWWITSHDASFPTLLCACVSPRIYKIRVLPSSIQLRIWPCSAFNPLPRACIPVFGVFCGCAAVEGPATLFAGWLFLLWSGGRGVWLASCFPLYLNAGVVSINSCELNYIRILVGRLTLVFVLCILTHLRPRRLRPLPKAKVRSVGQPYKICEHYPLFPREPIPLLPRRRYWLNAWLAPMSPS